MAEPLVYCVRCGLRVRADKTGEGEHSKPDPDDASRMIPCK